MADRSVEKRTEIQRLKDDIGRMQDRVDLLHGEVRSILLKTTQTLTVLSDKYSELEKLLEGE